MKQETKKKIRETFKKKLRNPTCPRCNKYMFSLYLRGKGHFARLNKHYLCPNCKRIFVSKLIEIKKEIIKNI